VRGQLVGDPLEQVVEDGRGDEDVGDLVDGRQLQALYALAPLAGDLLAACGLSTLLIASVSATGLNGLVMYLTAPAPSPRSWSRSPTLGGDHHYRDVSRWPGWT